MRLAMRSTIVLGLLLSRIAVADDDALYSCKNRPPAVQITLKPEAEVKDLVTWFVGFTCKDVYYDPHIVTSGRKVNVITPRPQTASEAQQLFVTAPVEDIEKDAALREKLAPPAKVEPGLVQP